MSGLLTTTTIDDPIERPRVSDARASIVPKLYPFLTQKNRIKVAYSGRGTGKTTSICRMLLILGMRLKLRILCCREIQTSIAASVHQQLQDEMHALGIEAFYEIGRDTIVGKNGTAFTFEGLRGAEARIKSMSHIDICWVEEADVVSESSWRALYHTLRDGSNPAFKKAELWVSFNPRYSTDPCYRMFVLNPEPGSLVVKLMPEDNPWFPDALREKMEHLKATDYDEYLHVYEGKLKQKLAGAVYGDEIRAAESGGEQSRFTKVPYDHLNQVDAFFDLGHFDKTCIWIAQKVGFEIHLIDFIEGRKLPIDTYLKKLTDLPYGIDKIYLPHDARAKELGTGMSIEEIVRNKTHKAYIVPKLSVEDGISAVRSLFPRMWFDVSKCEKGLEALRGYRYQVSEDNRYSDKPLHDENSNAADALRYLAVTYGRPIRSRDPDLDGFAKYSQVWRNMHARTSTGWMDI